MTMLLDEVPDPGGSGDAHPRFTSGARLPRRAPSLSPGETARFSIPVIQKIRGGHVGSASRLLTRLAVAFAGVQSRSLSRAVCRASVRDGRPLMLVASRGDDVFGLAIAVVDHVRFWRSFFTRHPLQALYVGWKRSGRGASDAGAIGGGPHPLSTPSWGDTGPAIAKVLFIGVAPEDRREGCGQRLYAELFRQLKSAGVARIDARIDLDNHASIQLHEATGWSVW